MIQNVILRDLHTKFGQANVTVDSGVCINGTRVDPPYSRFKPDVVAWDNNDIHIIEFSSPYDMLKEDGKDTMEETYDAKKEKYQDLVEHCREKFRKNVRSYIIIVSSLGAIHERSIKDIEDLYQETRKSKQIKMVLRRMSALACIGSYFIFYKIPFEEQDSHEGINDEDEDSENHHHDPRSRNTRNTRRRNQRSQRQRNQQNNSQGGTTQNQQQNSAHSSESETVTSGREDDEEDEETSIEDPTQNIDEVTNMNPEDLDTIEDEDDDVISSPFTETEEEGEGEEAEEAEEGREEETEAEEGEESPQAERAERRWLSEESSATAEEGQEAEEEVQEEETRSQAPEEDIA